MSLTQVLNPIEVRYASGELAQGYFIKLEDHETVMAERDYWHHMYNQATAPEVVDKESGLVNEMLEQ